MLDSHEVNDEPRPVMTFRIAGEWLAVPVEKMDRIAVAAQLWPVPVTMKDYLGLMDDGRDLVPVLRLGAAGAEGEARPEQLVAILHVRGESVGLVIDAAGRVYHGYRSPAGGAEVPAGLREIGAAPAHCTDGSFWLIDPDLLWQTPASPATTPFRL